MSAVNELTRELLENILDNTASSMILLKPLDSIAKAHPDLESLFGEFGATTRDLNQYMVRYKEIKSSYPDLKKVFAAYAGCFQKLDDFVKRYNEIKDSYPHSYNMYAEFAACNRPMDVQKVGAK